MIVNESSEANPSRPSEPTNSAIPTKNDRPKIIHSSELLDGRRELWIEHGDDMYRLRLTAAGKLYLTK